MVRAHSASSQMADLVFFDRQTTSADSLDVHKVVHSHQHPQIAQRQAYIAEKSPGAVGKLQARD